MVRSKIKKKSKNKRRLGNYIYKNKTFKLANATVCSYTNVHFILMKFLVVNLKLSENDINLTRSHRKITIFVQL